MDKLEEFMDKLEDKITAKLSNLMDPIASQLKVTTFSNPNCRHSSGAGTNTPRQNKTTAN